MPIFNIPTLGIGWIFIIIFLFGLSFGFAFFRNKNSLIDKINERIKDKVIFKVTLPHDFTNSANAFEYFLNNFHNIIKEDDMFLEHISLEIVSLKGEVTFNVATPSVLSEFIKTHLISSFPGAEIIEVGDYLDELVNNSVDSFITVAQVGLKKESMFPLKMFDEMTVDPIISTITSINNIKENESIVIELLVRPNGEDWKKVISKYLRKLQKGKNLKIGSVRSFFRIVTLIYNGVFSIRHLKQKSSSGVVAMSSDANSIDKKIQGKGFVFGMNILSVSLDKDSSKNNINSVLSSLGALNSLNSLFAFKETLVNFDDHLVVDIKDRFLKYDSLDIINSKEISSIFHFPDSSVKEVSINSVKFKKLDIPNGIPTDNCIYLGRGIRKGKYVNFGINDEDRRRNMYILGKSGIGKSSFLKNMIIQDIISGKGVGFIDPHGDLVSEIINYIPKARVKDVVLIDPSDIDHPVSLNIFESAGLRDYVADSILAIFKKYFDSWGPRLEYILHNAILTLLYDDSSTMLGLTRILTDPAFRKKVLTNVDDPVLKRFWYEEYAYTEKNKRLLSEIVSPIQNKIGRFTSSMLIRNIVGQEKNTINFDEIINNKKILLCDLSQGKIGEYNSSLLGSIIVTKLEIASLNRSKFLESDREDFYLYIDEFQNFATESFVKILSEARKYRLNLTIANQYISQFSDEIKNAIFGNVGTLISFNLGADDASFLAKEFGSEIGASDIINLDKYKYYIKESVGSITSSTFSGENILANSPLYNLKDNIYENTHKLYSAKKEDVEEDIKQWSMDSFLMYEAQGSAKQLPLKF